MSGDKRAMNGALGWGAALAGLGLLVLGCGGRQRVRDDLRRRAAADLHCPVRQVSVTATGMGGWRAGGCGQVASYTCGRSICALERREGHAIADGGDYTIGQWACDVRSTSASDADRIAVALRDREAALSACAAHQLVLAPSAGHGLAVLAVDEDRACAEAALAAARVFVRGSPTIRCERPSE